MQPITIPPSGGGPSGPPTAPTALAPQSTQAQQGCLCGRKCIPHPVFACTWGGFLLDAVLVAGGLLSGVLTREMPLWVPTACYSLSGVGVLHVLVNGCHTFYLCSWHPKKSLEQVAVGIEQAVHGTEMSALHVNQNVDRLEAQIKMYAETQVALESRLKAESERANENVRLAEERNVNLQALTARVAELTDSLNRTSDLKVSWQRIAQQASTEIATFHQSVQKFTSKDLEGAVVSLNALTEQADANSEEATTLVARINQARQAWVTILQRLYDGVGQLTRDVEQKARLLDQQKAMMDQLRTDNQQLEGNIQKLQPMLVQFETLTQQYQIARGNFDRVMQKLEAIRQLPQTTSMEAVYQAAQEAITVLRSV